MHYASGTLGNLWRRLRGWQWVAIKYIAAIIIITVEKAGTRISLRQAEEKKYKQNTSST